MSKSSSSGYAMSGVEALQIVFVVLKLCKVISWKWVWVLSPTWIMAALVLVALAVIFIIGLVEDHKICERIKKK